MLTAYFDDSGTHAGSDIVLVAGIFGTEGQLTSLERLWQHALSRLPLENPFQRILLVSGDRSVDTLFEW
jgi:hypothetical protein